MASHTRILNVTRNFHLKLNQAAKAVENCAAAWVEYGVSIRDLTLAESIAARNEQAKNREPLPFAEIPGLIFQHDQAATARESRLAWEANKFVAEADHSVITQTQTFAGQVASAVVITAVTSSNL